MLQKCSEATHTQTNLNNISHLETVFTFCPQVSRGEHTGTFLHLSAWKLSGILCVSARSSPAGNVLHTAVSVCVRRNMGLILCQDRPQWSVSVLTPCDEHIHFISYVFSYHEVYVHITAKLQVVPKLVLETTGGKGLQTPRMNFEPSWPQTLKQTQEHTQITIVGSLKDLKTLLWRGDW